MKNDLRKPCKNCPFGKAETRIKFACRERAEEIEEQAYRQGFPCHLSAEYEEDDFGDGGYVPGEGTQHCAGAVGMYLNQSESTWPGIDNDEDLAERIALRMGNEGLKMCFDRVEDFLDANTSPSDT